MNYLQTTDLKYVYSTILEDGFIFYRIKSASNRVMKDQSNEAFTPEQAVESIKHFMAHNRGYFTIVLRPGPRPATSRAKDTEREFYVSNVEKVSGDKAGAGIGGLSGGMDSFTMIGKVMELQDKITNRDLEHNTRLLEKERELMQLSQAVANSKNNDALIQMGAQILGQMFGAGGANMGINGLGDAPMEPETVEGDQKARINRAVVKLIELDQDFAENIEALAELAEKNRTLYDQGVSMIKNF